MSNSYSQNLGLIEPTPGDPSSSGTWGVLLNTNAALLDSAVAGILNLSVAGNSAVILTSNQGAADQSRNQHFNLSGALTGNINVLWPQSKSRMFSVTNNTTGNFTLSCGANNGSGAPAGSTVSIPQGQTLQLYSDGTNITVRPTQPSGSAGGDLSGTFPDPEVTTTHLSSPLSTGQGGTGVNDGSNLWSPGDVRWTAIPLSADPAGWLRCYGQAVSRTTYAALFAAIGITYGSGDGSTTFNVPDMRGRVAAGVDNMGGTPANRVTSGGSGIDGAQLGAAGGNEMMQQHAHTATDGGHTHTATDSGHVHAQNAGTALNIAGTNPSWTSGSNDIQQGGNTQFGQANITVATGHASIAVADAGSGSSQNMPPAMMLNCLIKT